MPQTLDFLDALVGEYAGALAFDLNGVAVEFVEGNWLKTHAPSLFLYPVNPDGTVCFIYAEGALPLVEMDLEPTAILTKAGRALYFWAFEQAWPRAEVEGLAEAMGVNLDDPVPMADVEGWEAHLIAPDTFQALDEVIRVYAAPEAVETAAEPSNMVAGEDDYGDGLDADLAPWEEPVRAQAPLPVPDDMLEEPAPWEEQRYAEALIKTPGWWPEDDPLLHTPIIISRGANAESKHWKPTTLPLGGFLATLCTHAEGAKDGVAFVCGEVIGDRRTANAMKALYAVGLDIDVGMPSEKIDTILAGLGCIAIRYTTHSHMKTLSEFRKDKVMKYAEGREIDTALIRDFLRDVEHADAALVASAEFDEIEHGEGGIVVRILHAAWPKNRVIIPLVEPFVIADQGGTQKEAIEKWKKVPTALAAALGVPIDRTGVDPSRLFYYPRHKRNKPHEIAIFGGALFDWRSLELDDPFARVAEEMEKASGPKSKSKTTGGRELGRWSIKASHGFQIADVLRDRCEDRVRAEVTAGIEIECPFDEGHSNAGDPEDRACLVVSAGDGPSEVFVIKCQHEGCRDFTNLDMLGKMLSDGWFPRDVLDDEAYNAAAPEDAPNPEVAIKIAAQDEAAKTVPDLVATLNKSSSSDDIRVVVEQVMKLADSLELDKASTEIRKLTGCSIRALKGLMAEFRPKSEAGGVKQGEEFFSAKSNTTVFRYYSAFNADEAVQACARALMRDNTEMPNFTCNLNEPMQMLVGDDRRVQFVEMDGMGFWAELCERVYFVRSTDGGEGPRDQVPRDVASQLYSTAWKRLPSTPEVIYTPIFTPEAQLLTTPGWYPELGILLADTGFEVDKIPENPTHEDIEDALGWIRNELLCDFPFLDFDTNGEERREPSEANAIAMLITPFMRRMIEGCTPVFFVAKPVPGTGGTLLGKMPMLIFDGEESFPLGYHRDNDDEQRKSLISAIMETRSHLFFDDVREFNSRVLLQSITARKIGGRLLGKSQNVERANLFNWVATGNNPFIGSEMERRIAWIRLNAQTADIQTRTYRHADFVGFLKKNRATAVWCILTLIQAWIAAGMPRWEVRKQASFEEWSSMVGGVLDYAGVEGFLDNRRAAGMDMEFAAAREFIVEWSKRFGMEPTPPKDLIEHAIAADLDIVEGNNEDQKRFRLKRRLESLEGVAFEIGDDVVMVRRAADETGAPVFRLEQIVAAPHEEPAEAEAA